ncbi:hypothetical protein GCM10010510_25540 [Streptomyces anandii JCM 4720]|nr:hypothetical protein GCM10010510_25540 [Streptomyces anandii JCM 4720]
MLRGAVQESEVGLGVRDGGVDQDGHQRLGGVSPALPRQAGEFGQIGLPLRLDQCGEGPRAQGDGAEELEEQLVAEAADADPGRRRPRVQLGPAGLGECVQVLVGPVGLCDLRTRDVAVTDQPFEDLVGQPGAGAKSLLVLPGALLVALTAGLIPAWLATRLGPMEAVRPAVSAARRARPVGSVAGLAVRNLLRVRGRTLLGAAGPALAVAAFTVLLALTLALRGEAAGSLLGNAVVARRAGPTTSVSVCPCCWAPPGPSTY